MSRPSVCKPVLIAALLPIACVALRADEPPAAISVQPLHTIGSNLRYRLDFGDLVRPGEEIVVAPQVSKRAIRIEEGSEQLLQTCLGKTSVWQKDPIFFRFGHSHPSSTIGCRERTSPSMHMVFYRSPEGTRIAWVHFDLHGPQNVWGHTTEVFRNRMTFGRTSEHEVYRGLVRTNPGGGGDVPEPKYDVPAHALQYLHKAFGPSAVSMALTSGLTGTILNRRNPLQLSNGSYADRISANLARNAVLQSIEFGTAAFLQQEQKFTPSGESGMGRRMRSAFYRAFFVPGRDGDELAFPRLAAAYVTPRLMQNWQPDQQATQNLWVQSGFMMGRYVLRSYWAEFKPDVKYMMRRVLRRGGGRSALSTRSVSIPVYENPVESDEPNE